METLNEQIGRWTEEKLGHASDEYDVAAYKAALAREWPFGQNQVSDEVKEEIAQDLLEGRSVKGTDGMDWVQAAEVARTAALGSKATELRRIAEEEEEEEESNDTDEEEEEAAPARTYSVWLGYRASIWAHRGYVVRGERVECESRADARRIVAESVGEDAVRVDGDGEHYYATQEAADADSDGSSADAVIDVAEEG